MPTVRDREFNLEGWGADKRLIEGSCGHCHHAVAFKEPEANACLTLTQAIPLEDDIEERTHYFVMGICPRPRCQEATIVYRIERVFITRGYRNDPELLQERVIFPAASHRPALPDEVPTSLKTLYVEAATIEHLSPNGSAFLARRILEQALRERFEKPRGKLIDLIDRFLETESTSTPLHRLMHDVREFGNIAGHPAQDQQGEWTTVDPGEASYTLDIVVELLDHIYVKPKRREQMRARWESKKRGESVPSDTRNHIIIGGREPPPSSSGTQGDDIPF
jgi:hypothetical protein